MDESMDERTIDLGAGHDVLTLISDLNSLLVPKEFGIRVLLVPSLLGSFYVRLHIWHMQAHLATDLLCWSNWDHSRGRNHIWLAEIESPLLFPPDPIGIRGEPFSSDDVLPELVRIFSRNVEESNKKVIGEEEEVAERRREQERKKAALESLREIMK
jgi:hypothetical protein